MHDTAPDAAGGPHLHQIRRRYVALSLVLVALVLLGILILIRHDNTQPNSGDAETFSAAPGSTVSAATGIPAAIENAVGVTSPSTPVTAPIAAKGAGTWRAVSGADGVAKPVVFFYGAEFSPYAGAERWPLVVALSRFGTFTQLGQSQSSATEVFADLASFTFWKVGYSSKWLTFQAVERYGAVNPSGGAYVSLQKPTALQAAVISAEDSAGATFPLVDIANRWVLLGPSFSPAALNGLGQADIAGDLSYATSPVTQAVVSAANELTAAICAVTHQQPGAVCSARGVTAADQKMGIVPAA